MKTIISLIVLFCVFMLATSKLSTPKLPEISKYEAVNPAWQDPAVYEKQHDIERLKVELRQLLITADHSQNSFKIPD